MASLAFLEPFNRTKPITKPMPDLLYISYLLLLQLDSWISEIFQWVRFAKKLFSSSLPFPSKLHKHPPARLSLAEIPGATKLFREFRIYRGNRICQENRSARVRAARACPGKSSRADS